MPDEPTNIFVPSGNVTFRPLAMFFPFLARYPSTTISVPIGMEFLFQPRRNIAFGAPPPPLFLEIVNDVALLLVDPAGHGDDEEL